MTCARNREGVEELERWQEQLSKFVKKESLLVGSAGNPHEAEKIEDDHGDQKSGMPRWIDEEVLYLCNVSEVISM